MKTRTMKIYEGGKLIETVVRPEVEWIGKPRKSIVRQPIVLTRRNGVGSNQYQTKSRSRLASRRARRNAMPQWKKTLIGATVVLTLFSLFMYGMKTVWEYKIDPAIQAFAKETGLKSEPVELISPIASPSAKPVPTAIPEPSVQDLKEERTAKLHSYLVEKKSPLAPYAKMMVSLADEHDIPWTLVAAISGKESTYGKNIKEGSFNAWGVMAWDAAGNRHIRMFDSWEEGIEFETKLLSKSYRHDMNSAIQARYCPSFECSDTWTKDVTSFQEAINE